MRETLLKLADILETLDDFQGADRAESLARRNDVEISIPEDIARAMLQHPERAVAVILPMLESALDKKDEDDDSSV